MAVLHSESGHISEALKYLAQIEDSLSIFYPHSYDILLQAENYDMCIDLLQEILIADTNNYIVYNQLASIYLRKKDLIKALQNFRQSKEIFPFQNDIQKIINDIETALSN